MDNTADFSPKAFIFDLNGTMIDDMQFHAKAWSSILNDDLGANLSAEQVKLQMYGKNTELLDRVFGKGYFNAERADEISMKKEHRYQRDYLPFLNPINGLNVILDKAVHHHIKMAIGSAAIPFNIDFVLKNLNLKRYFDAVVSADDVSVSKPDPETFLQAASLLNVQPSQCVVFEDAPKGVEAAKNAGMKAIVLTTMHEVEDFTPGPHILGFIADYNDPLLMELF